MVDEPAGPNRRRRRRKATRAQGAPEASATAFPTPGRAPAAASAEAQPAEAQPAEPAERAAPKRRRPQPAERGLRDLIGAGHSQLGVSGALRARDVNRPTDDDVAEAEQELVIVRRNWRPADSPPKSGQ